MSEHETHHTNYVRVWQILLVLLVVSVLGPMLEIQVVTLIFPRTMIDARPAAGLVILFVFRQQTDLRTRSGNAVDLSTKAGVLANSRTHPPAPSLGKRGGEKPPSLSKRRGLGDEFLKSTALGKPLPLTGFLSLSGLKNKKGSY